MATVKPFPALRPRPGLAARLCAPPYDVVSSAEARKMVLDNPLSFLHVSKPEIDLEPGIDQYADAVYHKGRENFQRLIQEGPLFQDQKPCYYLYRQVMGSHSQVGIVAVVGCEDYERNVVRRHEQTLARKEDDRVRHIETLNAQTGPAFLIFRANAPIARFIDVRTGERPEADFTADDGIRHTSWTIHVPGEIALLEREFSLVPVLYIADGHHRTAAAVRVWKTRQSLPAQPSSFFLATLFPHDRLQVLACNRLVRDLNGWNAGELIEQFKKLGSWQRPTGGSPSAKHEIGVFLEGEWHRFRWNEQFVKQEDLVGQLDVALLQKHVLGPLLGIDNPRMSPRIAFPGGIRGTGELEKSVCGGEFSVAFALHPVKVEDVMAIVDQGDTMPPKSTWFEPKLRDGMFSHLLE